MLIFIWGVLIMSVLNLWHVLKQPHAAADISEVLGWAQMNDRCSFLHCLAFHNLSWLAYWGGCCSMRAQLIVCHTAHALLIITHSLYGCTLPAHSPFTSVLYAKELASLPTSVPMPFTNKAPLTKQANNHSSHDADHGKGPLGPETSSMILNPWWVRATLQMSITLAKARAKLSIGFFGHRSSHSGKSLFRPLSHRVPTMLFGWRVSLLFLSCVTGVRKYNTNHSLCVYECVFFVHVCVVVCGM